MTNFTESLRNSILKEIDLMSDHGELLHPDDFIPGTYKFIIEYVGGKCIIETKEMVQSIVEQSVRLNKGVLIFKGFDAGSILFIYQISEAVKHYLLKYKFTEEDVFLENNKIMSLRVDNVTIMSSAQLDKVITYVYMCLCVCMCACTCACICDPICKNLNFIFREIPFLNMSRSDKTGLIALFCILRNTDLKY